MHRDGSVGTSVAEAGKPAPSRPSRPVLYFVRHGETDWNVEGRLQGQQDIPLNALGRAQAAEVGKRLASLVPDPAGLDFVASPMFRTRETMEILRSTLGLAPEGYRTDERLRELTFGQWEGLTWKEVRKADPGRAALREQDKWGYVPPDGESYAMLAERVGPFLDGLKRPSLVVAHGGVARAFLALACGIPTRRSASVDIWQGRILVIEGSDHRWV